MEEGIERRASGIYLTSGYYREGVEKIKQYDIELWGDANNQRGGVGIFKTMHETPTPTGAGCEYRQQLTCALREMK